jgi:hypothetical protein
MFPFIFGAVALGSGAIGVINALGGADKIHRAEDRVKRYETLLKSKKDLVEKRWHKIEPEVNDYYSQRENFRNSLIQGVVQLFAELEISGHLENRNIIKNILGFDISDLMDYYINQHIKPLENSALESIVGSAATSLLSTSAALGAVNMIGFASTGTAIGSLSGAAAWNATLAWFGGGSLAAGGGGMALGTLVLGGLAIGPALCLGGIHLHGQGEEATRQSYEYKEKVLLKVAEIRLILFEMKVVSELVNRLKTYIANLNLRIFQDIASFTSISPSESDLQTWWSDINNKVMIVLQEPIFIKDGVANPILLDLVNLKPKELIPERSIVKFERIKQMVQATNNNLTNKSYALKEKFGIQRAQAQCYEIAYLIVRWHEDHRYNGQKLNKQDALDLSQIAYSAAINLRDDDIPTALSTLKELETIFEDLKHHSDQKHNLMNHLEPLLKILEEIS